MTLAWTIITITLLVIFVIITVLVELNPKYRKRWILWAAMVTYLSFAFVVLYGQYFRRHCHRFSQVMDTSITYSWFFRILFIISDLNPLGYCMG